MKASYPKIIRTFLAIAIVFCTTPFFAHAATIAVTADTSMATVGQAFAVHVGLDTEHAAINAIQGTITVPSDTFEIAAIDDGDSPVSFWLEAPHETASGVIAFSGIVPGGFDGATPSLFDIVLTPIATGSVSIAVTDAELLLNDGEGSPALVATSGVSVVVQPAPPGLSVAAPSLPLRFTTPESFTPVIAQDPDVYGGKYFLVFSATDKGSGISHYEVLEIPAGTPIPDDAVWETATSPYLLQDQSLGSDIYVRAVNNAGNATTEKVPARFARGQVLPPGVFSVVIALGIALLALAAAVFFAVRPRRFLEK